MVCAVESRNRKLELKLPMRPWKNVRDEANKEQGAYCGYINTCQNRTGRYYSEVHIGCDEHILDE